MKTLSSENVATTLQGKLAVLSLVSGIIIACVCLFFIPPPGEIATSAISIVSELLILSGALLGTKVSYDTKFQRWSTDFKERVDKEIAKAIEEDHIKMGITRPATDAEHE
ncbi:MAG: hypothetical protein IJU69_00245 [Bacteroidales bacterium]|nr:hypothetical protein [Bacteroidales bacterium]